MPENFVAKGGKGDRTCTPRTSPHAASPSPRDLARTHAEAAGIRLGSSRASPGAVEGLWGVQLRFILVASFLYHIIKQQTFALEH